MGNVQKHRCSSSIVTAIPQFGNFAIPLTTLQNLKILLSLLLLCDMEFFWVSNPTKFFGRYVETIFQLQLLLLVILLITVLVSRNVIYLEYVMHMSHGVNKKALTMVSPTPPPNRFSRGLLFCK